MDKELTNLERAGRLLRLYGWLILIATLGMTAASIIPAYNVGKITDELATMIPILILLMVLSILTLLVGNSVKTNKKWAKITCSILAIIMLISPPVGTVLALFIFYHLFSGWNENQEPI